MTIAQIMLLASTCQTPRDWSEFRNHIEALIAQARDEEAEACAATAKRCEFGDTASNEIRARIAARRFPAKRLYADD